MTLGRPKTQVHERLTQLRQECLATLDHLQGRQAFEQPHPELSPLAWHVGHCFFTESMWLRQRVLGEDSSAAAALALYVPENSDKKLRGKHSPSLTALRDFCGAEAQANQSAWSRAERSAHELLREDYLQWFLVQHYAQHLETIQMLLQQHRLNPSEQNFPDHAALDPDRELPAFIKVADTLINVGTCDSVLAYDNELHAHEIRLPAHCIGQRPVSNANWLAFMADGGYENRDLWCSNGRQWLDSTGAGHPEHWRYAQGRGWHSGDPLDPLTSQAPVYGICWYEAMAFARWAGRRLPHEHELEHAFASCLVEDRGQAWEWCSNALAPYPGFRAFPYKGYSEAWFDGEHRVLRGGSRFTQPELRRTGFRNFYPEAHRHVFAGLRLAADG